MSKRLVRSTTDKQVAGVCAGLAAYFNVDPTLVRLAFVIATLLGGPGLMIYIVLWLVMPQDVTTPFTSYEKPKNDEQV